MQVGEGEEERENGVAMLENGLAVPQKTKHRMTV